MRVIQSDNSPLQSMPLPTALSMPTAMHRKRTASSTASRRQRVPPALTRGPERFEGLPILDEIKGDLGLVLWRSVRNILLWAATPAERRSSLFAGGAAAVRFDDLVGAHPEPELLAPLSVIVSLLERPGEADLPRVVNACRRIAFWAENRGALGTALEFTQAAALAAPESASLAFAVGRLSRRRAEYDRAESWYARAVILGRQTLDWKSYALAFSGMGNLYVQRGNYPAARRAQLRCLRASRRNGLRAIEAGANHDLFAIAVETGAGFEADELANQALQAYGPSNPMVPRLAYDVAYHWALQGYFPGALRVSRALLAHFGSPGERSLVLALAARAAGGADDATSFDAAALQALALVDSGTASDAAARTLLGVAHGALSLGRWEDADQWAGRAMRVALERKEGRVSIEAESLVEHARRRARAAEMRPGATVSLALADSFEEALGGEMALAGA